MDEALSGRRGFDRRGVCSQPAAPTAVSRSSPSDSRAINAESGGRIQLHIQLRANKPFVAFDVPVRPDHIDWFDPTAVRLATSTPHLMWTAWRSDTSGLLHDGRPGVTLLRHVVVGGGTAFDATYDVGAAVGAGTRFTWCTRAWIVDNGQAIASNVVCTR